jgi:hypothetical protein
VYNGGALAGLAVATEYHLAIVGSVLGLYAVARRGWPSRAVAYAAGVAAGSLPLLTLTGFFGAGTPDVHVLSDLLLSAWGLVTLTPVVAAAAVGAGLVARGGRRAEGLVLLGVAATYLVWASSLGLGVSPFGGLGPPRYLIPMLPFLAVGLATAFRRFPLATAALALPSAFQMVAQTATNPLAAYDGGWYDRLLHGEFLGTAASLVGITGPDAYLPFFAAAIAAAACAVADARGLRASLADGGIALAAILGWAIVALRASNPAGGGFDDGYVAGVALAAGGLVVMLAALAQAHDRRLRWI